MQKHQLKYENYWQRPETITNLTTTTNTTNTSKTADARRQPRTRQGTRRPLGLPHRRPSRSGASATITAQDDHASSHPVCARGRNPWPQCADLRRGNAPGHRVDSLGPMGGQRRQAASTPQLGRQQGATQALDSGCARAAAITGRNSHDLADQYA